MTFNHAIYSCFYFYFKSFCYWVVSILSSIKKESYRPKELALVRLDAIGDAIIWLNTARYYRANYQGMKISLICNQVWAELAGANDYFDEIIPIDVDKLQKNFFYRLIKLYKIKSIRYAVVISPLFSRTYWCVDWLVREMRSDLKIGSIGDCWNISRKLKKISDGWYDSLVPAVSYEIFELHRNFEFLNNLTGRKYNSEVFKINPVIDFDFNHLPSETYCVVAPGASDHRRTYPVDKLLQVVKEIPSDIDIVLCGSNDDKSISDEFISLFKGDNRLVDFIGKTSLLETLSIISRAKFLIGNETSSVHMAVAVGTPSICFLGGGHFGRFMPYQCISTSDINAPLVALKKMKCFNCNWICSYDLVDGKTWKCLYDIDVFDVREKIKSILNNQKKIN